MRALAHLAFACCLFASPAAAQDFISTPNHPMPAKGWLSSFAFTCDSGAGDGSLIVKESYISPDSEVLDKTSLRSGGRNFLLQVQWYGGMSDLSESFIYVPEKGMWRRFQSSPTLNFARGEDRETRERTLRHFGASAEALQECHDRW